jgi:hypothetical protein
MISIIMPSKGRAEQCAKVVRQFFDTSVSKLEVIILTEDDYAPALATLPRRYGCETMTVHSDGNAVQKWNEGILCAGSKWLLLGADDLWPHDGWDTEAVWTNNSGFVGFLDGHMPQATHYMVTKAFCRNYLGGTLAIPCYKSWGFDVEVVERAQRAGKYVVADTILEHRHHVWGAAPVDATYQAGAQYHAADMALLEQRRAAGFPNDFDPILI